MSNSKISQLNPSSAPVPLQSNDLFVIYRQGSTQYLAPLAQDIVNYVGQNVTVEAIKGISAGTQLQTSGTVSFGDSNGLTFGLSNGTLTGSYTVPSQSAQPGIQSISAGTTRITTGEAVYSNANNVTFGADGQTITASASFPAETPFGVSAGTQSVSTGTLVFSNSNGVTFGMSGSSRVTASVAPETPFGISAGTQSVSTGTLVFSNSNNVTFGMSGSSRVTASASFPAETPFAISAGTQSVSTGTMVFSDSNGISFGMSGSSRITASYTVPAQFTGGFSTGGNTVGDTGLVTGRLVLAGGPNITLSGSTNAGSITVSISGGAGAAGNTGSISAGTTRATLGEVVFSNSNSVSFGVNGQTVTASISTLPETPFGISAGTQSVSTGTLVFSNSNNVTFGMSGSSRVTASASFPAETPFAISAGTQSVSTGTMVFSDSNGISFGMSGSSRITASYTVPPSFSAGVSTDGDTLGSTGVTGTRFVFVGSNSMTLRQSTGPDGGTVWFQPRPVVAGVSNLGNTAGTTGAGYPGNFVLVGSNNITLSQSANAQSRTITIVGADQTVQAGSYTITGNTAANSTGTIAAGLIVNASTNITAWMSNGSLVLSGPAAGGGAGFSAGVSTAGNTAGSTGVTGTRLVFVGTNNISLSQSTGANGGTVTFVGPFSTFINYSANFPIHLATKNNISNITALNSRPYFVYFPVAAPLAFNRVQWEMSRSTSGSNAFSVQIALYSVSSSGAIVLMTSTSTVFSNTDTAGVSGIRGFRMAFANTTLRPGGYVLGFNFNAANTASMNYSIRGAATTGNPAGMVSEGTNSTFAAASGGNVYPFVGIATATMTTWPNTVSFSSLSRGTLGGFPFVALMDL